jgi:DNA-binding NtrC family response regulator
MSSYPQILVASPNLANRTSLATVLQREGLSTLLVSRVSDCQELLASLDIRTVFCERHLPDGNYRDVLFAARSLKKSVQLVVTSSVPDWDQYLEALREGASDLIASPSPPFEVLSAVAPARKRTRSVVWPDEL